MRTTWRASFALTFCAILLPASAVPAAYTFVSVADTTGQYFNFSAPAINADGWVTFRAELDSFHTGIYLGHDGGVTTIAHNNATSFQSFAFQTPGINSAGDVFFAANRTGLAGGGNGIFYGDGNSTNTYALNMSPVGITTFGRPLVSPAGEIAFRGSHIEVAAGPIRAGVFSALSVVESSSGAFADFGNGNADLAVNDQGAVVFSGMLDTGVSGIYVDTAAGGNAVPIADSSGTFSNFVHSSPSINNQGVVAFHASLDAGGDGIFKGSSGQMATPLVIAGGVFSSFAPVASINSAGTIVYSAITVSGSGLFAGPDFAADRILLAGDAMFGSTITAHALSNASLNDAGQIAFRYTLANGVNGIAVATPMPPTLPGDFDFDGDVDGRDFLVWQRGGSPNGVNSGDLALWQSQYGAAPPTANSTAVPEPATLALCLALALSIGIRRCQINGSVLREGQL